MHMFLFIIIAKNNLNILISLVYPLFNVLFHTNCHNSLIFRLQLLWDTILFLVRKVINFSQFDLCLRPSWDSLGCGCSVCWRLLWTLQTRTVTLNVTFRSCTVTLRVTFRSRTVTFKRHTVILAPQVENFHNFLLEVVILRNAAPKRVPLLIARVRYFINCQNCRSKTIILTWASN